MKTTFPLLVVSLAIFASCATTSIEVIPAKPARNGISKLALGEIELDSIYSYTDTRKELRDVIVASAAKASLTVIDGNEVATDSERIDVHVREKQYTKGFNTVNSLAIICVVRDSSGETLYRATYLYDGENSFDSLGALKAAFDELFLNLGPALRDGTGLIDAS